MILHGVIFMGLQHKHTRFVRRALQWVFKGGMPIGSGPVSVRRQQARLYSRLPLTLLQGNPNPPGT